MQLCCVEMPAAMRCNGVALNVAMQSLMCPTDLKSCGAAVDSCRATLRCSGAALKWPLAVEVLFSVKANL